VYTSTFLTLNQLRLTTMSNRVLFLLIFELILGIAAITLLYFVDWKAAAAGFLMWWAINIDRNLRHKDLI
jgi:hypothetical protein